MIPCASGVGKVGEGSGVGSRGAAACGATGEGVGAGCASPRGALPPPMSAKTATPKAVSRSSTPKEPCQERRKFPSLKGEAEGYAGGCAPRLTGAPAAVTFDE